MPMWSPRSTRPGSHSWSTSRGAAGPGGGRRGSGRRRARQAEEARRAAGPAECACQPEPRRIQLTPKQIEDGPIICRLCCAPFEPPEDEGQED